MAQDLGSLRSNTVKNYVDFSEPNLRSGNNDIFLGDIKPLSGDTSAMVVELS